VALIEIAQDSLIATIDLSAGGRIASFEVNGSEMLVTAARSAYDWGLYPMVPYAGRVRNAVFSFDGNTYTLPAVTNGHALHGTVMHHEWTVTQQSQQSVTLSTSLGEHWPFAGTCHHVITVLADRLRCELSLQATDRMPMQVGWHPWFRTPRHAITSFNAMLKRDEDGIATSQRVDVPAGNVDDCFLEPNAWPRVQVEDTTLEIASDCPFWVRFDAPFGDVCIEPQSGPPNGINDAPLILEAGATFTRWMELRIVENSASSPTTSR
jgi:aldose 1-epimerase